MYSDKDLKMYVVLIGLYVL